MPCLRAALPRLAGGRSGAATGTPTPVRRSALSCPRRWAGANGGRRGKEFGPAKNSGRAAPVVPQAGLETPGPGLPGAGEPWGVPSPEHAASPRGLLGSVRSWRSPHPLHKQSVGKGGVSLPYRGLPRAFRGSPLPALLFWALPSGAGLPGAASGFSRPPSPRGRGREPRSFPRRRPAPRRSRPAEEEGAGAGWAAPFSLR